MLNCSSTFNLTPITVRFKAKYKIDQNIFDKLRMELNTDLFLDNLVLHADEDIDWLIEEKLQTYERLVNQFMQRDSYKLQTDIMPFGKVVEMTDHDRNKYVKRVNKAFSKILQIAELSCN